MIAERRSEGWGIKQGRREIDTSLHHKLVVMPSGRLVTSYYEPLGNHMKYISESSLGKKEGSICLLDASLISQGCYTECLHPQISFVNANCSRDAQR